MGKKVSVANTVKTKKTVTAKVAVSKGKKAQLKTARPSTAKPVKKRVQKKKTISKKIVSKKAAAPKKNHPPTSKVVKVADSKVVAPEAPKPVTIPKGFLNAVYYYKFKYNKKKFSELSIQALKDLLRLNQQSMSGTKGELVEKCAIGVAIGRIPKCPKCFGGRPKFDYIKGTFYCSGYHDDVDFKNCHSTFLRKQLTFKPWY